MKAIRGAGRISLTVLLSTAIAALILLSVGTVLFQMAVHPRSGRVFVANTDARNEVRFEGSGTRGSSVRGHLHETRISILDADGGVTELKNVER